MFRSLLVLVFLISIMMSCNSGEPPEGVYSKEMMTAILLDIYITESELAGLSMPRDTTIEIFKKYEKLFFEKNDIKKEQYRNSLTYYYDHPDKLESIYETILDSLTLRESKTKARIESEKQKKDSLSQTVKKLKKEDA